MVNTDKHQLRGGFLVAAGDGHPLLAAGGAVLASAEQTHGAFSLIRSNAPAGDHVPWHIHHDVDEAFYVLEGEYTVGCGDECLHATAGAFVYLPRGVPHSYTVGASAAAKLILAVPGGLEAFFADMDADLSPEELMHRHQVTFLG